MLVLTSLKCDELLLWFPYLNPNGLGHDISAWMADGPKCTALKEFKYFNASYLIIRNRSRKHEEIPRKINKLNQEEREN